MIPRSLTTARLAATRETLTKRGVLVVDTAAARMMARLRQAWGGARVAPHDAACRSGLRQLGAGMLAHAVGFGGRLLIGHWPVSTGVNVIQAAYRLCSGRAFRELIAPMTINHRTHNPAVHRIWAIADNQWGLT